MQLTVEPTTKKRTISVIPLEMMDRKLPNKTAHEERFVPRIEREEQPFSLTIKPFQCLEYLDK